MELTLALGDYAHGRTLTTGTILDHEGQVVTLRRVIDEPSVIFRKAGEKPCPFDVTEMSLATTYVLADQGDPRFVPLPVFPSRMFRHSAFYVRDPGLRPEDLRGKRIGVVRYGMTAAVWARSLLADGYGIAPEDMAWSIGEPQFFQPSGIELNIVEGRAALESMLEEGNLDVLFSVHEPAAFREGRLHRLFPDFGAAERERFDRTGLYPIMHTMLVRRELAGEHPWLPALLQGALEEAKAEALRWLLDTDVSSLPLPFEHAWGNQVRDLLGGDPWPYGIEPNRAVLTDFGKHMHAQGLTSRPLSPEQVFGGG